MAIPLTINGATFEYPQNFNENWGVNATGWAQAVTNGLLQMAGGNFPLTADVNFGPNFGLLSKYFETRSALPATTGTVRLSSADAGVVWRNNANSGNLVLTTDASDNLLFNGLIIGIANPLPIANGGTNSTTALVNDKLMASHAGKVQEIQADASANSHKITNLANGTVATDAMTFGQKVYFQAVQGTTTSSFNTSSVTYVSTPLAVTITPSSTSHRVKISAAFTVRSASSAVRWDYAIFNGTTQLATFGEGGDAANPVEFPVAILYIDSPATISPITYTVQLRVNSGVSDLDFNVSGNTQVIIAEEIV